MRAALTLPTFKTSSVLNLPGIKHRFYTARTECGQWVDFQTPLKDEIGSALLASLKAEKLIMLNQQHTDKIVVYPGSYGENSADGVLTQKRKTALLIKHADCQAALFYDPVKKVIAAVHAGFRGQAQKIYSQTIERFQKEYGSFPKDIRVAISPSLSYEAAEFVNYQTEFPKSLHRYYKEGKMDLKRMALEELLELGILKNNLDVSPECTFLQKSDYHSYRRDKTINRLASVLMLE